MSEPMNLPQRIVLVLGFLAVLAMASFPPWVFVYSYPGFNVIHAERSERPAGYHSIFGQHVPQDQTSLVALFSINVNAEPRGPYVPERDRLQFFSLRIDWTRLAVQLVAVVLLTSILYFALRRSRFL